MRIERNNGIGENIIETLIKIKNGVYYE